MKFLGVPLFDQDIYVLIFRFVFNLLFSTIIIRKLYYGYTRRSEYVFTFYMVSTVIFFLCFTLQYFTLDLGIALGLFAIFGILRYRTQTIEIKEMTYLFVVIGISVINALANENMSYAELVGVNVITVATIYFIERLIFSHGVIEQRNITYDKLEDVKPENYETLVTTLKERTGLEITQVSVGKVDFANKIANLTITYRKELT